MEPSAEYIRISEQKSETVTEKQDQLIILDLNGTLCSRTAAKTTFFLRPHAKRFFDYIFQNYTVMVWSSAQVKSVQKMCQMFLPYKPGLTWDRSHFNLTTEDFYRNSKTIKDLNLVWEISDDFNATNTIIIDDTSSKLSAQPYNLMLMSTFDHKTYKSSDTDNDLLKAITYLKSLRYQTNVANYMKEHPFDVTSDYEIEKVDPLLSFYVGHYVNGVLQNPPPTVDNLSKKQKKKLNRLNGVTATEIKIPTERTQKQINKAIKRKRAKLAKKAKKLLEK